MSKMTKEMRDNRAAAYQQVFGEVNGGATKRVAEGEKGYREMRVGKTKRDKAKGHSPHQKNVRVWESNIGGKGNKGAGGRWVKVNQTA